MRIAVLLTLLIGALIAASAAQAAERPAWKVIESMRLDRMPEDLYQAILTSSDALPVSGRVADLAAPPPADAWDPMVWVDAGEAMTPSGNLFDPPKVGGRNATRLVWTARIGGYEVLAWEHLHGFVGARRLGQRDLIWVSNTEPGAGAVGGLRSWADFKAVIALAAPPIRQLDMPPRLIDLGGMPDDLYQLIRKAGPSQPIIRRVRDLPAPLSGRHWADVGQSYSTGDVVDPGRPYRAGMLWNARLGDYLLVAWTESGLFTQTVVEAYRIEDPGRRLWSVSHPLAEHWPRLAAFQAEVAKAPPPNSVLPACSPLQAMSDLDANLFLRQRPSETYLPGAPLPLAIEAQLAPLAGGARWLWAVRLNTHFVVQYPGRVALIPYSRTDWDLYAADAGRALSLSFPSFDAASTAMLEPTRQKFAQGGCLGWNLRLTASTTDEAD